MTDEAEAQPADDEMKDSFPFKDLAEIEDAKHEIDVPLPNGEKLINRENDCGPIAVDMILQSFGEPDRSLEELRDISGKDSDQGSMPGNIVKGLKELGYDVKYYSRIDWAANTNPDDMSGWDPALDRFSEHFRDGGYLPKEKFADSSMYLSEHKDVVERLEGDMELDPEQLRQDLDDGKRLMALVRGSHWVIITEITDGEVKYNDPEEHVEASHKTIPIKEFYEDWKQNLGSTELIVVDKTSK
jgi:hypothetical protein